MCFDSSEMFRAHWLLAFVWFRARALDSSWGLVTKLTCPQELKKQSALPKKGAGPASTRKRSCELSPVTSLVLRADLGVYGSKV